ncbi:MAG: translation elongation factor-like protein [Actinobacteria bacterium]|nr:translation elongation factor-like protein [Actinomycetota bacterium]MCI0545639.1 translation elongation factor-like protein [Actinomycetota bacterium]MCI0679575.1 translation elongation factor-like protein [Actinomycetota bacterium]
MSESLVGVVDHWFGALGVAGVEVTGPAIKVGDTLHFSGNTTDFTQEVGSMQLEHEPVTEAHAGDRIGIKVVDRVRNGDSVFLLVD